MSYDPEDFKPIPRKCVECGAKFYVPYNIPRWAEPEVCETCDELGPPEERR